MEKQSLSEKLDLVGKQILRVSRNELYLKMRFLDVALSSFYLVMDEGIGSIGTDGLAIYFQPQYIGGLFREDRVLVNRVYLHMVLHGIFRHMVRRKGRDRRYYDLACEIAVESIIDEMQHRCVLKSRSWLRKETYRKMKVRMRVLTADKIYMALLNMKLSERELLKLEMEFQVDSHVYWPDDKDKKKQEQIENQWQNISEQMETDMDTFSKESSSQSGNLIDHVKVENRERFDYKQFLRKFSVLKEEMTVDQDSFDYVFYSYGLELYGNMPLIEPQEWKEVQKIEEFVIVIDTSMSCSGELVRKFLEQTYAVLSENDSFFRKVNIHIIQCDDQIQTDQVIKSEEELVEYMKNLELRGEGGTDFRPAFEYVDKLRKEHAFIQLKGLLYFTDGQGNYPNKRPSYEVAFIFLKEDYEDADVPPWAMKLILEEEDLV
ncbi:MAG: VWA-like domain-containing protein [Dorea sp.]